MRAETLLLEEKTSLEDTLPDGAAVMLVCPGDTSIPFDVKARQEIQPSSLDRKEMAKISLKAQSFQKAHADNTPTVIITMLSEMIDHTELPLVVSFLKTLMREQGTIIVVKTHQWPTEVRETIEPLFETVTRSSSE